MNPYDDSSSTRRARTSHSWDDHYPGGQDYPPEDDYPAPAARASVGRASVGRAPVPDQGYGGGRYDVDPYGPTYEPHPQSRDPYASGSYGSGPHGSGPYGDLPPVSPPVFPVGPGLPGPMGQPGPGPEMPGRGVVGRASVRPISPSGSPPGVGGPGGGDGPGGRGPGGPGGRGPRDPFGRGGPGDGPDGDGPRRRPGASDPKRAKKARRRNLLIAGFAVFIMLAGLGVVGGTYYVDGVKTSDQLKFPETTTVYYSNGAVLAKLGEVTRYPLKFAEMNDAVVESIVASEDKTFWTNEGVDFTGVMRAAWNNFTGGSTQGASTITQQYARVAFDLEGATYSRKLREAVMAWKIDDQLSKKEILEYYLNSVPFGRQTYGIEAAAQAFFGKTANRKAKPAQQITDAEAMVLVSMVKQPNPDPGDPDGSPGYDPTFSPKADEQARVRWDYVRGQMVELGYLSPEENAAIAFPKLESFRKYDPKAGNGIEKPDGLVVNHVLSELTSSPNSVFKGKSWKSIMDGGYKIYTTIHPGAQKAAEAAADETVKGSYMYGQPASLQAALVAVEPGTGRVLAYFGGHDGKGADYGGFYYDETGVATGVGRFPAGSSFKVYTLAAALREGYSLNSYWQWTPHDMPGRTGTSKIRNASSCPTDMSKKIGACSLLNATIASLNVPFYELTVSVTPAKVLAMARDAGIDYMWTDQRVRQELFKAKDTSTLTPNKFDIILGIGQYPITVMDHANGVATFAAGGLRAQAHFVTKVMDGDKIVYGETLPKPNQPRIMTPEASNDLTYALSKVSSARLNIGWDSAGKTGTWEYNKRTDQNAHAWMVGYTKKIAAAVWVGNEKDEKAIVDKYKHTIWGSGIPASIWRKFMVDANAAMKPKKENTQFNEPNWIGNTDPDRSVPSPTPPAEPPKHEDCIIPNMCPSPNPTGPAPGNGNGNGGVRLPSTLPPYRQTGAPVSEP